jgi:hypothetical protein
MNALIDLLGPEGFLFIYDDDVYMGEDARQGSTGPVGGPQHLRYGGTTTHVGPKED